MINKEIVICRGFDLVFSQASESVIRRIAYEIGEGGSFNIEAQSVTYMSTKHIRCEFGSLEQMHFRLKEQGLKIAERFGCVFEASELYISITPSIANWLTANGSDLTKPILI